MSNNSSSKQKYKKHYFASTSSLHGSAKATQISLETLDTGQHLISSVEKIAKPVLFSDINELVDQLAQQQNNNMQFIKNFIKKISKTKRSISSSRKIAQQLDLTISNSCEVDSCSQVPEVHNQRKDFSFPRNHRYSEFENTNTSAITNINPNLLYDTFHHHVQQKFIQQTTFTAQSKIEMPNNTIQRFEQNYCELKQTTALANFEEYLISGFQSEIYDSNRIHSDAPNYHKQSYNANSSGVSLLHLPTTVSAVFNNLTKMVEIFTDFIIMIISVIKIFDPGTTVAGSYMLLSWLLHVIGKQTS